MQLITVAGPPTCGKTCVILKALGHLRDEGLKVGVVKFDCLTSQDAELFEAGGFPVLTGISANFCPDHFFISNIEDCAAWGARQRLDLLVSESAGLCNRCAPHIKGHLAVCVLDNLSGVGTPRKVGPMLKTADLVLITKGDIVSQAEREVFAYRVRQVNAKARILFVNGITGQGAWEVSRIWKQAPANVPVTKGRMRFTMPAAVCSYCFGETRIGEEHQHGNVRKIKIPDEPVRNESAIHVEHPNDR
jgi:Ni2+-binding GTPase involved in maturation of urease and hydrogenase